MKSIDYPNMILRKIRNEVRACGIDGYFHYYMNRGFLGCIEGRVSILHLDAVYGSYPADLLKSETIYMEGYLAFMGGSLTLHVKTVMTAKSLPTKVQRAFVEFIL